MSYLLVTARKLPKDQILFSYADLNLAYSGNYIFIQEGEEKPESTEDTSWLVRGDGVVMIKLLSRSDPIHYVGGPETLSVLQEFYEPFSGLMKPRIKPINTLIRPEYEQKIMNMIAGEKHPSSEKLFELAKNIRKMSPGVINFDL